MKKLLLFILLPAAIACNKDNNSPSGHFAVNLNTETSTGQNLSGIGSCQISTGSGGWAGDRVWDFTLSSGKNIFNVAFVANFPGDKITLDSTFNFYHRKGDLQSNFFVNYQPDGNINRPGTDSSFFQIKISSFDGHTVNGSFAFQNYDPGVFAIGENGSFTNIQVDKK